jgi:membrane-associated phospholipid phosphatase
MALISHKCRAVVGALSVLWLVAPAAAGQVVEERAWVSTGQAASFAGAGALFGVSILLDRAEGPPRCAPCDLRLVPVFDRWAVRTPDLVLSRMSDVLLLGLAGATLVDSGRRPDGGGPDMIVSLEGAAWTYAVTQLSKAVIGRLRPVMYTDQAAAAAGRLTNQRSMPSGHASAAFAFAAGYWANSSDAGTAPKLAAMIAAAGVAALRVAAAKHFPSDVLVGALVGTASALVVHEMRF